MNKRFSALMAAGILALACFTGCGKDSSTKVIEAGKPKTEASLLPPGVEYKANKGEEYSYEKLGMQINFTEIALTSEDTDPKGMYSYALVFTATNNGSEVADIRMLDDFEIAVDGKSYGDDIYTALSAANGAVAYQGMARYDAELEPGETVSGFVPFGLDTTDWKELTVTYYPDRSRTNDTIIYTVDRSELVNKF